MNLRIVSRWQAAARAVLCCLAMLLPSAVQAEQPPLVASQFTSGSVVRRIFRPAVEDARQSTVRLRGAENKDAALGTIVSADGWILSKSSQLPDDVISGETLDHRKFTAEVFGRDTRHDVALLKTDLPDLEPVEWLETGEDPQPGRWLATVGLGRSPIAVGVVSVGRRAIARRHVRGVLGVELMPDDDQAIIKSIFADSGAEAAGLQAGDIVTRAGDEDLSGRMSLIRHIARHQPGDTITLQVERDEETLEVEATLGHPFGQFLTRIAMQNRMGGNLSLRASDFPAAIQHDTVLRPEDCGGPVVDLDGNVIGINIARSGRTESLALPADLLIPLIEQLQSQPVSAEED